MTDTHHNVDAPNAEEIRRMSPEEAMRALIRFNFRYHLEHPEFVALVNNENLMGARKLKRSKLVPQLYSPLLETLTEVLRRGQKAKVFRSGVDPMQLYISIAGEGYFYLSNRYTLTQIFGRDLMSRRALAERSRHIVDMILHAVDKRAS